MRCKAEHQGHVAQPGTAGRSSTSAAPPQTDFVQKLQAAADHSPVVQRLYSLGAASSSGNGPKPRSGTVQLVADLTIGGQLVDLKPDRMKHHVRVLKEATGGFEGEVWFNSEREATGWFTGKDREGLGVWAGRWMNFKDKGPIVFGEEHNAIRQQFIEQLRIRHYLVEGAHELSLEGVASDDLPKGTAAQALYSGVGAGGGKALENYWVRNALTMEFYWSTLETQLLAMDVEDPHLTVVPDQVPRHLHAGWVSAMRLYLDKIATAQSDVGQKSGIAQKVNLALVSGQYNLKAAQDLGLNKLLDLLQLGTEDALAFRSSKKEKIRKINDGGGGNRIARMAVHLGKLREIAVELGELNFQAQAGPEALAADDFTKNSKHPHEKWNARRELFMLKNLEHALNQTPKPYIITIGGAHARNQETAINALLSKHGGRLIIGNIMDLADYGAIPMRTITADIEAWAQSLADLYGWAPSSRDDFAASPEAAFEGKRRVHEGLKPKPTPSYIA